MRAREQSIFQEQNLPIAHATVQHICLINPQNALQKRPTKRPIDGNGGGADLNLPVQRPTRLNIKF